MLKVLIFAGANGAGKTTIAKSVLEPDIRFINADDIQREEGLSDIDAGQKALNLIDISTSNRISFAFETTMAGLGLDKRLNRLKKLKYGIVIFYLFAHPKELLVERIKERIKKGGHPVPEKDIIRRYGRSLKNFWTKYRLYAEEWNIICNNELEAKTIAVGNRDRYQILDKHEFNVFEEVLNNV